MIATNLTTWRSAVLANHDGCVDCGISSPLHAHHVIPKALRPDLKLDVSNGIAVCPNCHWKRHLAEGRYRREKQFRVDSKAVLMRQIEDLRARLSKAESMIPVGGELLAPISIGFMS